MDSETRILDTSSIWENNSLEVSATPKQGDTVRLSQTWLAGNVGYVPTDTSDSKLGRWVRNERIS